MRKTNSVVRCSNPARRVGGRVLSLLLASERRRRPPILCRLTVDSEAPNSLSDSSLGVEGDDDNDNIYCKLTW